MPMVAAQTLGPLPAGAVLATLGVVGRSGWAEKPDSEDAVWARAPAGLDTVGVGSATPAAVGGPAVDADPLRTTDGCPAEGGAAIPGEAKLGAQPPAVRAVRARPAVHDPIAPSRRITSPFDYHGNTPNREFSRHF